VICVGAAINKPPTGEAPEVQLTMVYVDSGSGTTFGTCPVQTHLLSPRTLELLNEFLRGAEQDFGERVFGEGVISTAGEQKGSGLNAESNEGLRPRGLGGRG
jgi:hypothetical protein